MGFNMKKLLLSSLIGFVLVGCGENKVTEEMLIGDWECTLIGQEAKWKDGKFEDYSPIKTDNGKIKYFMKNNTLYFNFGTNESYPYNLHSYYSNEEKVQSNNGITYKVQKTINYVSQNKFQTSELTEINFDNNEMRNKKIKVEVTCDRITE